MQEAAPILTPSPDCKASEPAGRDLDSSRERRQFSRSYEELSPDGRELGIAVDEYKLRHRRRFVNFDEMIGIIQALGYRRNP
jgi:hypothetical protein